jgi:hypothetical protein
VDKKPSNEKRPYRAPEIAATYTAAELMDQLGPALAIYGEPP